MQALPPLAAESKPMRRRKPLKKKKHKASLFTRLFRTVLSTLLLLSVAWGSLGFIGDRWIAQEKLATFEHPPQTYAHLSEMPDYVWQAFIAIEDHRFTSHPGVDPLAIGRALWIDVSTQSKAQGSSTISMQLARNLFLTNDKTMERKIKEALVAVRLEQKYSKEELLEMYLNTIYFGHGKYGIDKAADFYFGKTVQKNSQKRPITLGEAAILASLPKAPESYSPVKNLEKAKSRQKLVLNRMEELGLITKAEKDEALKERIVLVPLQRSYATAS